MKNAFFAANSLFFLCCTFSSTTTEHKISGNNFPHPLHLKEGLTCVQCHAGANNSIDASDLILPETSFCLSCHTGEKANTLDPTQLTWTSEKRSYRFSHAFHTRLGNMAPLIASAIDSGSYLGSVHIRSQLEGVSACQACHRGLKTSDKTPLPVMSDCLICHSEIDNPFSCRVCHLDNAKLRPADHTARFVDLHSTGKIMFNKANCLPCHGTGFACRGCH